MTAAKPNLDQTASAPTIVLLAEGALASIGATFISNPFEVAKIRLQLQGELKKKGDYVAKYNGMLHCMAKVMREEGPLALQKGLVASLFHQTTQNSVRLGLFPQAQALAASWCLGQSYEASQGVKPPLYVNVLAGATVGAAGCFVGSPFFLVKTRLQAQNKAAMLSGPEAAVGHQHKYTGTWDALRSVYSQKGIKGLFHGATIAVQRTSFGSATQLASYEWAKGTITTATGLKEKDMRVHVLSSIVASFVVVATVNPLEVVMVRKYAQSGKGSSNDSLTSALRKIIKTEGVQGLYKGSIPLFSRLAPHFIATFVFLEQIRNWRMAYYSSK